MEEKKKPGRPRKITPEITKKILELRDKEKKSWREIAEELNINRSTATVIYHFKKKPRNSEND
jgi:DNA invertase Pin-like site-specific DNA recombinase